MQDLTRLLREHPEWRDELRRELLTDELLQLPQRFAEYTVSTDARLDDIDSRMDDIDRRLQALAESVEKLVQRAEAADRRLDRIERNLDRMSNDFRNLRWNYAESATMKEFINIAIDLSDTKSLGIDETSAKIVTQDELLSMASVYGSEKLSAIPKGDRQSFYRSDLVIKTRLEDGDTCYIAVEASYTSDDRDIDRALTHAELITRFTRKAAWPVVASVRVDNRIHRNIDEGDVFWYPLDEDSLHP